MTPSLRTASAGGTCAACQGASVHASRRLNNLNPGKFVPAERESSLLLPAEYCWIINGPFWVPLLLSLPVHTATSHMARGVQGLLESEYTHRP